MHAMNIKARVVLALAGLFLLLAATAHAESTPLQASAENGTLVFSSADGQFRWWLDGRVNLDGNFFIEDKNSIGDGVQIRRSRLAFKTILWRDWYGELDVDFSSEATAMKDAFVRYDNLLNRTAYVRVGNFKEPFGLEEVTSSRNLLFLERSQGMDAFMPGRKLGIEAAHFAPSYRVAAGMFGPDAAEYETQAADMTWNFTGRATWNAMRTANTVLHVGTAGSLAQPQFEGHALRFKTRNEYHVNNFKYVDTDVIDNVNHYNLAEGEIAYVNRRLRLQSEGIHAGVVRTNGSPDVAFKGGYVVASFFLTPDRHPYDYQDAEFGRVKPTGKYGAWELVSRFSSVDMTDQDVHGGNSTATTIGLNWYANANVRVLFDFVMVNNDKNANAKSSLVGNDDFKFIAFRFLTAF
jgi:phosphate-selective porin OprO and OprP